MFSAFMFAIVLDRKMMLAEFANVPGARGFVDFAAAYGPLSFDAGMGVMGASLAIMIIAVLAVALRGKSTS